MFRQSRYPADGGGGGMINGQQQQQQQQMGAASVPRPPPPAPFNVHQFTGQAVHSPFNVHQLTGQAVHSPFTPECHQFPYTFSSATPPMYSWANTSSTDVMKFTGSSSPQPLDTSAYHLSNFGSIPKRKIDYDAEFPQPPKMRITEEKVSASLRDMHISSEFKPHSYCLENNVSNMDIPENVNFTSTMNGCKTSNTESQNTLVMCEELRKLNKIDSIIPQPLLNLERPKNAVVVWKPQPVLDLIRSFSSNEESKSTVVITEITDEEENALINQNEMLVEDNNCFATEEDEMEL